MESNVKAEVDGEVDVVDLTNNGDVVADDDDDKGSVARFVLSVFLRFSLIKIFK